MTKGAYYPEQPTDTRYVGFSQQPPAQLSRQQVLTEIKLMLVTGVVATAAILLLSLLT